jgi:hypothetical protein
MKRLFVSTLLFMGILSVLSGQERIEKKMEIISSFIITNDSIVISVNNSGYTGKDSFVIDVNDTTQYYEIYIMRIKSDNGKMMPEQIEIVYKINEFIENYKKSKPIKMMNLFSYFDLF